MNVSDLTLNGTCIVGLRTDEKLGITYLATCLVIVVWTTSRRLSYTFNKLRHCEGGVTVADVLTCITVTVCSAFVYFALIFALAGTGSPLICELGIFLCITLYTASKGAIYLLFMEKAYQAQRRMGAISRFKSRLYRVNAFLFSLYGVLFTLMIIYSVSEILNPETEGLCFIGIETESSVPLVIYDSIFSVYLTTLFLIPVLRSVRGSSYRTAAQSKTARAIKKNFIGMLATTIASGLNILSLAVMPKQRMVVCFSLCATDILVNCAVVQWTVSMKSRTSSGISTFPHNDKIRTNTADERVTRSSMIVPSKLEIQ